MKWYLFPFERRGLFFGSFGVLLSAESAIGLGQQAQGSGISRIGFSESFEIGQSAGKIRLLNLRFRQSQSAFPVV